MDDYVADRGIRLVRPASWLGRLLRGEKGVLPTLSNALVIMANDPLLAEMFAYNAFTCQHLLVRPAPPAEDGAAQLPGPYPRPWTSEDISLIQSYLQRIWCPRFGRPTVEEAALATAAMRQFHPVVEWLSGLKWDGKARIYQWLTRTFGCECDEYHRAIGSKLLIAAVRRVRQPGVKFDHLVVLEGGQGIGKSSALVILFGRDWTTDDLPSDLGSKDAAIALSGAWCIELAEIEQLIRSEAETVKAFLSRSIDRFRPPYGRHTVAVPRQSVLVGTTNSSDYLRDATGNRRIWPVECLSTEAADLEWLTTERDQLWAEAAHREQSGEAIWLEDVTVRSRAVTEQADRVVDDPWDDVVRTYAASFIKVTVPDILRAALGVDISLHNKNMQMRVAEILRRHGWKKGKKDWDATEKKSLRAWHRVSEEP